MTLLREDFEERAVSPLMELGAYEALWDEAEASFRRLSERFAAASIEATLPVLFPEEAGRPFGLQNLEQWQEYADWMRRNDLLTQPVDVGTAATNEFLPGEGLGNVGAEPKAP